MRHLLWTDSPSAPKSGVTGARGHNFMARNPIKPQYNGLITPIQIHRMIIGTGCANCGRIKTMVHQGYDCCGAAACMKSLAFIASSHIYSRKLGGPPRTINKPSCLDAIHILDRDVSILKLSARSQKAIKQLQLKTIGDLTKQRDNDLLACRGFGPKCLKEIKDKLAYRELSLNS